MTEQEWLTSQDPNEMLAAFRLGRHLRRMRLFLVAHCRRAQEWLGEPGRAAVLIAERFAEGRATAGELEAARQEAGTALGDCVRTLDALWNAKYRRVVRKGGAIDYEFQLDPEAWRVAKCRRAAAQFAWYATMPNEQLNGQLDESGRPRYPNSAAAFEYRHAPDEMPPDADNVRCIFGNPFRRCAVDARWRTPTALAVAREMYESGDFSPAGVLADALEDAGCDDGQLLGHLRGPAPHVRGCHVVDLLLGNA
jgi:hypothetical protein